MDSAQGSTPPEWTALSCPGSTTQHQDRGVQNVGGSMNIGAINFHDAHKGADEQKKALVRLLSFSSMSNRKDTVERTYRQTCEWFLQSDEFADWRSGRSGLLWIKGNPGSGKSTMMKFVIKNIQKAPGEKVVSHFFNARGGDLEQSAEGLCQSLLVQLLYHVPSQVFATSETLCLASEEQSDKTWALPRLLELLEEVIDLLQPSPITIFVDAVDECNERQLQAMVDSLCDLLEEMSTGALLRICFASRYFPHVTREGATEFLLEKRKEHYQDVSQYIAGQLSSSKLHHRAQLQRVLQAKAGGSFIWAFLVIRFLKEDHRRGKVTNWQTQIEALPVKLEELYRTILNRHEESRDETLMCYKWVLITRRQMNLKELWWAIRLSCTDSSQDASILTDFEDMATEDLERRILDISRGFVTASDDDSRVQFIHETAREFAMKETGLDSEDKKARTHELFKNCCWRAILQILNFGEHTTFPSNVSDHRLGFATKEGILSKCPLALYASDEILHHADEAQDGDIDQSTFLDELYRTKGPLETLCILLGSGTARVYAASSMITLLAANDRTNLIFKCRSQVVAARHNHALGLQIDSGNFAAVTQAIEQKCLLAIGALMALHVKRRAGHPALCSFLSELGERACEEMWNADAVAGLKGDLTFYPDALFDLADFQDDVATFFLLSTLPPGSHIFAREQLPKVSQVARNGFKATLEYLLGEGIALVSFSSSQGLFCWAAARGHVGLLDFPLRDGAIHNPCTLLNFTPLDLAVREGHVSVVQVLRRKRLMTEPSWHAWNLVADREYEHPYIEIVRILRSWDREDSQGADPGMVPLLAREDRSRDRLIQDSQRTQARLEAIKARLEKARARTTDMPQR
ncbi:AAA ATPase domain-containing protein [Sarocladium implicatum]|nr:AAA ATPase domain-containing protein [Sarocladium implicatum]